MSIPKSDRSITRPQLAASILAVFLLAAWWQKEDCPTNNPLTSLTVRGASLSVEVAANVAARNCGLAFRDRLPAAHGMLFVHAEERFLEFWMKDTRIPLDLAYIGDDRRIREILSMRPDEEGRLYRSRQPARYALETSPGWFTANGISVGDAVDFSLPEGMKID